MRAFWTLGLSACLAVLPAARHEASPRAETAMAQQGLPTTTLTFPDGKTIEVDLAVTPMQREIGLMNRVKLPRDYGMLFVFPVEQGLQFWMKNTFVDLDMVFLDAEGRVTALHSRVRRSYRDTPEEKLERRSGFGKYVLELPAGAASKRKVKVGKKLRFAITVPVT